MTSTYRLRGTEADSEISLPSPQIIGIRGLRRIWPGTSRAGGQQEIEVKGDEVVRVELENGFVLWTRADDLVRDKGKLVLSRDGGDAFEIDMRPRGLAASRGLLSLSIKALDFFGVDLKAETARGLGRVLEKKQLKGNSPGLYRLDLEDSFALAPLPDDAQIPTDGPLLIFLHGTASSGQGSFGKLWAVENRKGAEVRKALAEQGKYGDKIFAFEHRSLTESPIQNALELAKRLPAGAELHLVSHSRGGLVGELLCLGQRCGENDPLRDDLIKDVFAADRTVAEQLGLGPLDGDAAKEREQSYERDRESLKALRDLLRDKQFKVSRFVRVACPARGTTLASGRLDRWLSVLSHLAGDEFLGDALDFLLAVVKERTDPRTLPGLEAMMPGSALTRLLQHPDLVTESDLTVIAGDIEGEGLWSQIKLLATDWFYGGDHDLVINTGSMFGGIRRAEAKTRFRRDRGAEVNHFDYFRNEKSVTWLQAGLLRAEGSDGGFQSIKAAPQEEPRWRAAVRRSRAVATPRPLAVVLPGTMGSSLHVNGDEVWLNYWRLLRGGLKRLHLGAVGVQPTDLLDDFYGPLLEFLSATHRVEIFPYDWRFSIREAARRLGDSLENWLPECERRQQPVHIVAHSMGGLVVRAMIADPARGSTIWRRINALPQSRFLMLGTPNRGSYEAVRWLTGKNPTLAKLSLLDITQGANEIIDIVRYYPGLLELLPFDDASPDFSQATLWQGLKANLNADWHPAEESLLRQAGKTWEILKNADLDPQLVLYVAGCQPATVTGYQLNLEGGRTRLDFLATRQGDGTVTWQSGALEGIKTWYVEDTGHDELCANHRAFPGYLDLLMTGATIRLPATPPAATRAAAGEPEQFFLPALPVTDDIPDESGVRALGFGPGRPLRRRPAETVLPLIEVSITHGDLAYARHPVVVGHYLGDTIVSAEAALDQRLEGALSKRLQLGLYPGQLRTHALFFNPKPGAKPTGAVVIGLGQVGELSPGLLEAGVRNAMLDFALQRSQCSDANKGVVSVGFSCMLVGSGAGGMSIRDSVEAILRGAIQANRKLSDTALTPPVLIDRVEFLELFEDLAIAAAEAMENLARDGQLATSVVWRDRVIEAGQGGRRRVRFDEDQAWWHRLEIIEDQGRDALRFIATTDRARAEETQSDGQLLLADGFIRQATVSPATNTEVSKTLFEMLLPNRLKELAPQQANLVLLVDEVSARYPWELLEDRWSQNGRPPAVSGGLVRQLKTKEFRPIPAHAIAAKAYVVGNPDLGGWESFPDLPGARQEAQSVARLLAARSFRVEEAIDQKADTIIQGLHRDAWRILHLSGHGEHEFRLRYADVEKGEAPSRPKKTEDLADRPSRERFKTLSGMVIGDHVFLTPGDVEQMRWVPELVFINCCHLGKTLGGKTGAYHELAANLAVQFIRMGVKAVVAAGWAVDDAAATAFAESFYTHLLDNETFGEAVRAAREEVWMRFPHVNTWGAYQCYGDPSYRLRADGAPQARRPDKAYHVPAELVADLENQMETLRMEFRSQVDPAEVMAKQRQRLADLVSRIPEEQKDKWLARADVAAALGMVWGEAGVYGEATQWLEKALQAQKAELPVRALEQYANFLVRGAAQRWSELQASGEVSAEQKKLIERIDGALEALEFLNRRAATVERCNLLGSAYKRLALLQSDRKARLQALVDMARHYRQAIELSKQSDPYPFTNWALARLLAVGIDKKQGGDWQNTLTGDCQRMIEAARVRNEKEPNFWDAVSEADCELIKLMANAEASHGEVMSAGERIIGLYRQACQRGASPREIASVRETLDFVSSLNREGKFDKVLERIRGAL